MHGLQGWRGYHSLDEHRQASRQSTAFYHRCLVGILSFTHLDWTDHVVRVVDISSRGVGIESDEQLEQGLTWFHSSVGDNRGGILIWSRKQGELYRAGIRLLSLSEKDERSLRFWPPCNGKLRPCSGLEESITTWMRLLASEDHADHRRELGVQHTVREQGTGGSQASESVKPSSVYQEVGEGVFPAEDQGRPGLR